jgi:hypothetical protein
MRIRDVAFATVTMADGRFSRQIQLMAGLSLSFVAETKRGKHKGEWLAKASPVMFPPPGPAGFQKVGGRQEEGQPAFTRDLPESFPHLSAHESARSVTRWRQVQSTARFNDRRIVRTAAGAELANGATARNGTWIDLFAEFGMVTRNGSERTERPTRYSG